MNNPYHAPGADLSRVPEPAATYRPTLWTSDGRIGRLRYLAYSFGATAALLLMAAALFCLMIGVPTGVALLRDLGFVPVLAVSFMMSIRRLNDLDRSGWWSLLLLAPLINLLFGLWLLLAPGTKGENSYGPEAAPNSPLVVLGAIAGAACTLLVAGSLAFAVYQLNAAGVYRVAPASGQR